MAQDGFVYSSDHRGELEHLAQVVGVIDQIIHLQAAGKAVDAFILHPDMVDRSISIKAAEEPVHFVDALTAQFLL